MRVAAVQHPSVFGDRAAAVERCAALIAEAAAVGAELVAFPETWLGGYPAWCFGAAAWEDPLGRRLYRQLLDSSVLVGGADDQLGPVRDAAREGSVVVVLGLNELAGPGSGTVYNSQVVIDRDGTLVNHHRKLVPTSTEKNVWSPGDAAGLRVVATGAGRVGGLICWEHWNPLARQVLHAGHEDVHVAAWPDLAEAHELASRTYAIEGRCFVVVAANVARVEHVPEEMRAAFRQGLAPGDPGDVLFDGGSGVIGPDGAWLVGPERGTVGLVLADIEPETLGEWRFTADVAGHYQRPDVFQLRVDAARRPSGAVTYVEDLSSAPGAR
ncbi:carbon-nitrogen hydrolase family protein [Nocardioides sp. LHD-245]|uniref:carbon-nitrogen hydrolase family protein n=1 Tax=Nocardioides sp. LHD-245 TaxID=3051387 RepID=UPI0027DFF53C|nr:carbon-nitrogen hydrolase family protein [Nocardioides sp. LHD-245]